MRAESYNHVHAGSTDLAKYLIVNADDFGQSAGINRGIITAYREGIVTSASLMVRWPAAAEAAAYARTHPGLSVGLHVDLGEQVFRAGEWVPLYTVVPLQSESAVRDEVFRQLGAFERLVGHAPSHLDSHQNVHLREPVCAILTEIAQRLDLPLRHCSPEIAFCGNFYGQTVDGTPLPDAISIDGLIKILDTLPAGSTELGCHPAAQCDLDTMYRQERLEELKVLCDIRARAALTARGIGLRSFAKR
ncbi:MAG TPA: ChbG/HpnK family deacetylase [Candidatus Binatia bacterium]|nr:ChbG/HpnK family deacetylase [Candidatus Binatia bacterium]